jgi:hypothetical protein
LTRRQQVAGHEPLRREDSATPGVSLVTRPAPLVPFDLGGTGQVQCAPGVEVGEEQRRLRVDGQVAEGVEEVVARVVAPPEPVAVDADEARPAAPVRGVRAAFRVRRAEEERVCRPDQPGIPRRQDRVPPDAALGAERRAGGGEEALVDVLRAVPVGLFDLDDQALIVRRGQHPVDADPAACRELDDHEPGLLAGGQPVQRVARR